MGCGETVSGRDEGESERERVCVCIIPDPVSYSIFSLPQPLKEGKRQDPVREETERGNKPTEDKEISAKEEENNKTEALRTLKEASNHRNQRRNELIGKPDDKRERGMRGVKTLLTVCVVCTIP